MAHYRSGQVRRLGTVLHGRASAHLHGLVIYPGTTHRPEALEHLRVKIPMLLQFDFGGGAPGGQPPVILVAVAVAVVVVVALVLLGEARVERRSHGPPK